MPIKGIKYRNRIAVTGYLDPESFQILQLLQEQLLGISASKALAMGLRCLQDRIAVPLDD